MGASQSSAGTSSPAQVKTSYYELLGVQRSATEEELKMAYRKKALELHPDRNYGDEEKATKVFAEVQAAYEVLSDPQERAWYDSHESAILRGDDVDAEDGVPSYDNVKITTADDLARMVRKFNSGVEFSDAPSGFFGFLRETFEQLAREEEIAADWEGSEPLEYPTFGHKDDAYDDVVKSFYAVWSSFSTAKNFSWKDKYRLSEAPDRWYRRRMEQENKKYRQDGIREFNDAVRSLVAFVRKRDPRYVPSTQTEEERQKVLRDAAAAQRARAREENEAKMQAEVPEWTKSREPDPLAEMEGTFSEEDEEEHVFECVACNKIFKSERQWEAHEKSKKHQKAVKALQQKMRKDNANLDLNGTGSGTLTPDVDGEEDLEALDDIAAGLDGGDVDAEPENGVLDDDTELSEPEGAAQNLDTLRDAQKQTGSTQPSASEASDSEDEDYASPETIQARLASTTLSNGTATPATAVEDKHDAKAAKPDLQEDEDDDSTAQIGGKKMGKAAQKRAKKAAAAAAGEQAEHHCAGCDAAFPTKTRLFQHLKDHPKHAALKPAAANGSKKKKGKR